jgi:RNA polymerase sigma factor (TIGR02999 family)
MPSETPHHARRDSPDVTELLVAWSNGDDATLQTLAPLIERGLHRLAAAYMARERPGHVLQPTALVNEAYLRLIDWKQVHWQNRAHFFGVAAQVMRRVLVDMARAQRRVKRGGRAVVQVSLSDAADSPSDRPADLVALDDALKRLATLDPQHGALWNCGSSADSVTKKRRMSSMSRWPRFDGTGASPRDGTTASCMGKAGDDA